MRPDMHKVIVERPRRAWDPQNRTVRADRRARRDLDIEGLDALPHRGPIEPDRGSRKWLNENLAPLLRFLRRRVGRPWDAVYGELRAHLAPKNAVQMHVIQHLFQYVDRNVVVVDGQICSSRPYFWLSGAPRPLYDDGRTFYVCPETGRLCRPKARPPWRVRTPKAPDPDRLEAPDGRLCLRLDGQWYAISRARIPVATREPAPRDAVFHLPADATPLDRRRALYGDGDLYARTKRQLSHAELRTLGLR
jgi:hypothetical protein